MTTDDAVEYREALAAKLRSVRAGRGLEQADLAARMKVLGYAWHRQTVGAAEAGTRKITAEEVLGLSLCLETSLSELMAPIAGSGRGRFIRFPNGALLGSSDVSRSAGAGAAVSYIGWKGNEITLPPDGLMQMVGDGPDQTAAVRAAMDLNSAPVYVPSADDVTDMAYEELISSIERGMGPAGPSESAAARRARLDKSLSGQKTALAESVREELAALRQPMEEA